MFQLAAPNGFDVTKTNNITPQLLSDEGMTSAQIYTVAGEGILFEEGGSRWTNAALDDSQGDRATSVYITIFAPDKKHRSLFQDEVERVLRTNRPAQGTKIKQSDGTTDSAILGWSFPLPDWNHFELGLNTPERSAKVQMILYVLWQASWQNT
jgi:hypothetical protein